MKGLFIKDLKLLANQKKTLAIFLAMMAIFMVTMENGLYVINYITFFGSIIAIGTLSYDEIGNGMTFMFTLPVSRREYVLEKYLFCLITGLCVWLLSVAVAYGMMYCKGIPVNLPEFLMECLVGPVLAFLMISVMLPLQIKLGQEKSRTGLFIFAGLLAGVISIMKHHVAPTDEDMNTLLSGFRNLGLIKGMSIFFCGSIIVLIASCLISIGIISKKEY